MTIFGGGGIAGELICGSEPFRCHVTVVRKRPDPSSGRPASWAGSKRDDALSGADAVDPGPGA